MKAYCFECDEEIEAIEKEESVNMWIDDIQIDVPCTILVCPICGHEANNHETNNKNIKAANTEYMKRLA